jgi:uncharacterized protein
MALANSAGGQTTIPPSDVRDSGRMSFVLDSNGAPIAMCQAGEHEGAGYVNEAGAQAP